MSVKRRSFLVRGAVAVLLLVAVGLGVWFVWSTVAMERREAALRAKGYPVTAAELNEWYETPPVGENAAESYLAAYGRLLRSDFPEYDKLSFLGSDGTGKLGWRGEDIGAEELERTAAFFEHEEAVYALISEGARRGGARYPVDFALAPMASFDHFGSVREVWRAALLKLHYYAAVGDAAETVAAFEEVTAVVNSLIDEPSVLAMLTRLGLEASLARDTELLLNETSFSTENLLRLDGLLASLTEGNPVLRAAIGERCYTKTTFENVDGFAGILGAFIEPSELRLHDRFIELVERPAHEYLRELDDIEGTRALFDPRRIDWLETWTEQLPWASPGGMSAWFQIQADAKVAAVRGAVLVERLRIESGALPETLEGDALPEGWPVDPCTGEPIRYRKMESGYVTYSVGRDLVDDGGAVDGAPIDAHHEREHPDIAIRVLE